MSRIRILLVEDNRLLRAGITAMINGQADMKVVETSGGGLENIQLKARTVRAQVILVDQSSSRLVASLTRGNHDLKVIGMGLVPSQSDIVEFVQAGASGFILKNAPVEEFLMTIRSVAHGEKVLPPQLTGSVFSHVVDHAIKQGKNIQASAVRLTQREREIVALIADALSNKEIGQRLNLSTYTVKSHVHNILEKLALHSCLQISTSAYEEKLS